MWKPWNNSEGEKEWKRKWTPSIWNIKKQVDGEETSKQHFQTYHVHPMNKHYTTLNYICSDYTISLQNYIKKNFNCFSVFSFLICYCFPCLERWGWIDAWSCSSHWASWVRSSPTWYLVEKWGYVGKLVVSLSHTLNSSTTNKCYYLSQF